MLSSMTCFTTAWLLISVLLCPSSAQHWWQWENRRLPQLTPFFTPLPGQHFTHQAEESRYPIDDRDVVITIPKAGLGTFVGFSDWVNYDWTWTQWPARRGRQVNCFLGIPYAAPPVGNERFRLPRPSYLDTRFPFWAKRYRPACMQNESHIQEKIPNFNDFSEDCLYLNVFYPNRTWEPPTKRYPVVVHIHGGSFVYGSSHLYPGHALASQGLVVVTFNYRLGPFGFLSTGDFASIGNYGLWDQLEALKWVRDNIWWFYGDPTQVTLMGESAGAASVGLHLVSPVTRPLNLFHKVIMMSGSDLSQWAVSDPLTVRPKDYAKKFAEQLGCGQSDHFAMVYCLRYLQDAKRMTEVGSALPPWPSAPADIWTPVVDGAVGFLPRMPLEERRQGRFSKMPILAGVVHDEAALMADKLLKQWGYQGVEGFLDEQMFQDAITKFLKYLKVTRLSDTFQEIFFRYNWWSQPLNETARKEQFIAMLSDYFINSPLDASMRYQAADVEQAYFYEYAWRGLLDNRANDFGIYHGVEIPFLFGYPFMNQSWWSKLLSPQPAPIVQKWDYPYDTNMSEFTMQMWTNFIVLGEPTPYETRNFTWLPFTNAYQDYAHIFINASNRQHFRQTHLAFWRNRFERIAEPEAPIPTTYPFPVYDVQIASYSLACVVFLAFVFLVALIVYLCRKPTFNPDDYDHGKDEFHAAFSESHLTMGAETDV